MSEFEGDEIDDDTPAFRGLSRRQLLASAAASAAGIAAIKGAAPAAAAVTRSCHLRAGAG